MKIMESKRLQTVKELKRAIQEEQVSPSVDFSETFQALKRFCTKESIDFV